MSSVISTPSSRTFSNWLYACPPAALAWSFIFWPKNEKSKSTTQIKKSG